MILLDLSLCLLDGDDTVACLSANSVKDVVLKEGPHGTAHGGAVVDDKDSRCT